MQIRGNVFIVTGGASGLGGATSTLLATEGGQVVIADVQADKGEALERELGGGARFVRCDVSSESDGKATIAAALSLGTLRGLINCAGIAAGEKTVGKDGPHKLDSFARVIGINLIGTFNMIRLAAEAMSGLPPTAEGERGVIVNTASVAAFDGQIGQAAYSASKAGVVGMTLPIARDLARNGIRVVTIAPGIFETPMLLGMAPELQQSLAAQVPFPSRFGRPGEYAHLVKSILENCMLNGETIRLDGAIRMQPK
ncbi:MAG TPA: 3-hydroxyacyl-CoA dehydrogenase [Burkholderiaceae bacterium]|nr:3-hydroxyacyl-CoA dehydrogenase [Burkholderiaceae bacterium]